MAWLAGGPAGERGANLANHWIRPNCSLEIFRFGLARRRPRAPKACQIFHSSRRESNFGRIIFAFHARPDHRKARPARALAAAWAAGGRAYLGRPSLAAQCCFGAPGAPLVHGQAKSSAERQAPPPPPPPQSADRGAPSARPDRSINGEQTPARPLVLALADRAQLATSKSAWDNLDSRQLRAGRARTRTTPLDTIRPGGR